jgi:hypothetical protein
MRVSPAINFADSMRQTVSMARWVSVVVVTVDDQTTGPKWWQSVRASSRGLPQVELDQTRPVGLSDPTTSQHKGSPNPYAEGDDQTGGEIGMSVHELNDWIWMRDVVLEPLFTLQPDHRGDMPTLATMEGVTAEAGAGQAERVRARPSQSAN